MKRPLVAIFLALAACARAPVVPATTSDPTAPASPVAAQPAPARTAIFISDLHMGPGKPDANGGWHPFEDFRWADDLAAFLDGIAVSGGGKTDLVLLGDAFDLWQSWTKECSNEDPDLGCTEAEADFRMERVLRDHAASIAAIGAFARRDDNRVWVIPGNHDVALVYPKVSARLLAALAAPGRAAVLAEGFWLSPDGKLYAEHGHQVRDDLNRYKEWPPFIDSGGKRWLRRSWGEQMVRTFYDAYEKEYPVIDNVNSVSAGISYGLARERLKGFGKALGRLLRFALLETSFAQATGLAGKDGEGAWDIAAIQAQKGAFLRDSLAAGDPLRADADAALAAGELDKEAAELSPDEIDFICDERAALAKGSPGSVALCPVNPNAGALRHKLSSSKLKNLSDRLSVAFAELQKAGRATEPFKVFLLGHTHEANSAVTIANKQGLGIEVANSGAWQRVVSPTWFETAAKQKGLEKRDWLTAFKLEDLPRCYSFIRAPADGGAVQVRYWTMQPDGKFAETKSCVAACTEPKSCLTPAPIAARE